MTRTISLVLVVIILVLGIGCSPADIEPIDTTAPTITDVLVSDITDTSAVITWNTDEPADSQVSYGITEIYAASSELPTSLVTNHTVTLTDLTPSTTYHFQIQSSDASGNQEVAGDNTFTTADITTDINETGVVTYIAFGGGFWGLIGDDGEVYDPLNLDFKGDGIRIQFAANYVDDQQSAHRWGTPIDVIDFSIESYTRVDGFGADWDPHEFLWDPWVPVPVPQGIIYDYHDDNWEIYVVSMDGSSQTRLTYSKDGYDRSPKQSPDGTKILFSSDIGHSHKFNLFVIDATDSKVTRLTYSDSIHSSAWSPDSTKIAFSSSRDGISDIYIMDPDGSNRINVTNTGEIYERQLAWSPDGTKISFMAYQDNKEASYVIDATGENQIKLTGNGHERSSPAWSPDGAKIAFSSYSDDDCEIYIANADGGGQTQLTYNGGENISPVWSPDGTQIAFLTGSAWNDRQIYIIDVDGSNQTKLTNESRPTRPVWSPDGTKIAFSSRWGENFYDCIFVINADGSSQIKLTNYEGVDNDREDFMMWTPDSARIVFRADRDNDVGYGSDNIYIIDADGNNEVNLTNYPIIDHG